MPLVNAKWVTQTPGVPIPSNFNTTNGLGSPLVVDNTSGQLYYISTGSTVIPVGGITLNIQIFGAKGDNGVTDNTAAFAAAFTSLNSIGGGILFIPRGRYKISAYLSVPHNVIIRGEGNEVSVIISSHVGGGGANAHENLRNGSTLTTFDPINSSTRANITIEDIGIENSASTNVGAGYYNRGGSYINLIRVRVQGHRFGCTWDQSELVSRIECQFEFQVNAGAGEWMVNKAELNAGASIGFTNNFISTRCQYNQNDTAIPCIVHDGGYNYTSINDNFNGGKHAGRLAGIECFSVINPAAEGSNLHCFEFDTVTFFAGVGVGDCSGSFYDGVYSAPNGYGGIHFNGAGWISVNGQGLFSTPSNASIRGCANVFKLKVSPTIRTTFATDPVIDSYSTYMMREEVFSAAAPSSDYWYQGQLAFNNAPIADALLGWRCTASGSPGTWEKLILSGRAKFDHFTDAGNVGTGETDLYSDNITAGQLSVNGDKLDIKYGGSFVAHATATRQIKLYFGGTAIFDTGALTTATAENWRLDITIIRVSSSVIRYDILFNSTTATGTGLNNFTKVDELTGLTLANTNTLKITGTAAGVGAANNDIVAKMGTVLYVPAV